MRQSYKEFAIDMIGRIKESCPTKFYSSGANDNAVLKILYLTSIPDTVIMKTVEVEAKKRKRFCLADLKSQIFREFKKFTRENPGFSRGELKTEVVPTARLSKLKNVLVALIIENLGDIDKLQNLSFLEKIEKLKTKKSKQVIEKELYKIENDFYSFLLKEFPDAKDCIKSSIPKVNPYKYYWKRDTYLITLRAIIKRCLKEKYNVPEFTIT